jgi:hypothetical protein
MDSELTCPKCLADTNRPGGDEKSAHTANDGCLVATMRRARVAV